MCFVLGLFITLVARITQIIQQSRYLTSDTVYCSMFLDAKNIIRITGAADGQNLFIAMGSCQHLQFRYEYCSR